MVVKIYRYKISSEKWPEFIDLQKKADKIYSHHISYKIEFVRDIRDGEKVTEIHTYPDLATAKKAEGLHEQEPELNDLFRQFKHLLNRTDKQVHEEFGELINIREQ